MNLKITLMVDFRIASMIIELEWIEPITCIVALKGHSSTEPPVVTLRGKH